MTRTSWWWRTPRWTTKRGLRTKKKELVLMMQSGPVVKFDSSTLPAKVNQAHGWRSTGCAAEVTQEEAETPDPDLPGRINQGSGMLRVATSLAAFPTLGRTEVCNALMADNMQMVVSEIPQYNRDLLATVFVLSVMIGFLLGCLLGLCCWGQGWRLRLGRWRLSPKWLLNVIMHIMSITTIWQMFESSP